MAAEDIQSATNGEGRNCRPCRFVARICNRCFFLLSIELYLLTVSFYLIHLHISRKRASRKGSLHLAFTTSQVGPRFQLSFASKLRRLSLLTKKFFLLGGARPGDGQVYLFSILARAHSFSPKHEVSCGRRALSRKQSAFIGKSEQGYFRH